MVEEGELNARYILQSIKASVYNNLEQSMYVMMLEEIT
jgi:hypothetical protein